MKAPLRVPASTRTLLILVMAPLGLLGLEFLTEFFGHFVARREVLQFEKGANFDLRFGAGAMGGGRTLRPFDGLLERLDVDDPEAADQFLGFCEGTIDDADFAARKSDAFSLRA